MKPLKPLLATNVEDFSKLRFPAFVSPKLDGVRATVYEGILYSRSLKPIPNKFVQELFCGLPEGTDGELIVGEPNEDPYRTTVSIVMSDDKPLDFYGSTVRFYIFDNAISPLGFQDRFAGLTSIDSPNVVIVPHIPVEGLASLEQSEKAFLSAGYEGLMYRSPDGIYKHGRSSEREQILLKVKRFKDAEARIVSAYEEMENNNVAFTNELGRTARSSAKGGKTGKGQLGGFHVVGCGGDYDGIEFDVPSSSIVHTDRVIIWKARDTFEGKLLTYKYFPTGGDTRPRHPIFKGMRDARDL